MAKKKSVRKSAKKKSASKKAARKKTATKKSARKKSPKKKAEKKSAGKRVSNVEALKEKLQNLLEKPDTEKRIIRLLAPLDEAQRKAIASHCVDWLRKLRKNDFIEDPPGTFRWNPLMGPAEVAVFCVSNLTEIKKLGRRSLPEGEALLEILKLRKPKWADQIADMLLEGTYYWGSWPVVREMVKLKLCPKPKSVRYYTGMITGLCGGRWGAKRRTALQALRNDPSLLKDEVWKLFEYEGDGENTLANIDRWEKTSWSGALATLSKEGKLSRPKLLASALGALELGFNHYRAKWFYSFFDLLEPTDRELKKHADTILNLVGSSTPNVATWAFEKAIAMHERGLVKDTARLANAVSPLLMAKQKGTVQKTLKFLGQLTESSPRSVSEICVLAADAMGHEKIDVQKSAFKLISKHATASDPQVQEAVQKYPPLVAASFRKQLTEWLETAGGVATNTPAKKQSPGKSTAFDRSRLKKYPASHRALLKIDELVAALDGCSRDSAVAIPAATFDGTEIPRLDADRKITPISDVEELIEVCGRVLEDSSLIDEGERAIDGISRLHGEKPDDFRDLVGPLLKRATTLFKKRHKAPFVGESITADLCGLVQVWVHPQSVTVRHTTSKHGTPQLEIHGVFEEPYSTWRTHPTPLTFLSERSLELARRITEAPALLLSAPTHNGGWIDPIEWVRRINSLTSEPGEADLILSLLRLAPHGKESALKSLKTKLKGEWVNVAKYALGGKVQIGKSAPLWIAAARARTPLRDDPKVSKAFRKHGPDSGKAPRFLVRYFEEEYAGKTLKKTAVDPVAKRPKKLDVMVPTQLLYRNQLEDSSVSFWDLGIEPGSLNWVESISPLDCNAFFAAGGQCLVDNLDWWEAAWHNRCFLNPLLDPDTPLGDIGLFMLFCGLAAKEPGEHGLATDITIQAINDGRLGTDNLRDAIAQHAPSGVFNLTRLAARFQDVAAASDLHALVVMLAWEQALGEQFDKSLRGLGNILELLYELGTQLQRSIENHSCQTYLESFSGSNKTAKAAKQLLKSDSTSTPDDCLHLALENRLSRLEAWASR